MVVGATLGWLVAIVVDRDDRMGSAACALAGTGGSVIGALLSGDIPLLSGISPTQLLWSVVSATIVIVLTNVAVMRGDTPGQRNV